MSRGIALDDQDRKGWFVWQGNAWVAEMPTIEKNTFVGTGTRHLTEDGKTAIRDFYESAFGPA